MRTWSQTLKGASHARTIARGRAQAGRVARRRPDAAAFAKFTITRSSREMYAKPQSLSLLPSVWIGYAQPAPGHGWSSESRVIASTVVLVTPVLTAHNNAPCVVLRSARRLLQGPSYGKHGLMQDRPTVRRLRGFAMRHWAGKHSCVARVHAWASERASQKRAAPRRHACAAPGLARCWPCLPSYR